MSSSPAWTVRPQWMASVARQFQVLIGETMVARGCDEHGAVVRHLVDGIPDTANRAEDLVLRAILADVSAHFDHFVQSGSGRGGRGVAHAVTRRFRPTSPRPAKHDFVEWAAKYSAVVTRSHRASSAQRAAGRIRKQFQRPWRVVELAKLLGCGTRSLRRDFQREYGTSIPEHCRRVRVLYVIDRFSNGTKNSVAEKIEPVAMEAGFRSKNGFYTAFQKSIGLTPTEFRQLPAARAREIVEAVKASLIHREDGGHHRILQNCAS